ncbi:MAG: AMP-binding protein [Planctomycetota bacterium]|nr:AMP-binding protein [Planctomycetota bacterium]
MPNHTDITLLDLLERARQAHGDKPAVLGPDANLTYAQLHMQAVGLGAAFMQLTQKNVLAMFLPMIPPFPGAFFGAGYAGKAALPLNMLLPGEDLAYILADSGADTIVTIEMFKEKLKPLPAKIVTLEELKAKAAAGPAPDPAALMKLLATVRPKPESTAAFLYTSGTTGKAKGVELTHRNLASNTASATEFMHFTPDYRVLACLPTFHTLAITATMLAPLAAGGSLFTFPKFDPDGVLQAAEAGGCNVFVMVPSMYRLVTRRQDKHPHKLDIKLAIAGGEPLPEEVRANFERVFKIPLHEGYGLTETSPVIAFNAANASKPGTVGKPLPGVAVKIVDPETMQDVARGGTGEVWAQGPNIMKGYHNKAEETAKVLTPEGWFRTGDMGLIDAEGFLQITGRLKEMIKVGGEMVFPAEVENALLKHPSVHEAGVVGERDDRKGEVVKAFVALYEGKPATADELIELCRKELAPYKVPKSVEFRPELPKGPTGKVLRRLLK